tara:strand:+ start:12770 stop:13153 length:384 start_codon:yes stop_codon:yes gene_type:complete
LDILPIDEMPYLKKQLGKARTGRIRYHQKGTYRRQPAATNVTNTVYKEVQGIDSIFNHPLQDVLTGLVQNENHNKPISINSVFTILQCMQVINSREIGLMFDIGDRQARKYLQVIKAALPFIEKELK